MQNNICLHRDRDIKNKIRINKKAVAYMRQPEIYLKILNAAELTAYHVISDTYALI